MAGGGEMEPKDSRHVTGTKGDPNKSWREQETSRPGGEYEPVDSRNVTNETSNPVDRWQDGDKRPPLADHDTAQEKGSDPGAARD